MDIKDRIFYYMAVNDISQKELAEAIGVTKGTVSDWKKGRSKSYNSYLLPISVALGIPLDTLIKGKTSSVMSMPKMSYVGHPLNKSTKFKVLEKPVQAMSLMELVQERKKNLILTDEETELLNKYRQLKAKYPNRKIILKAVEPDSYEIL